LKNYLGIIGLDITEEVEDGSITLQAIEDRWTNDQPNYKAAVDTAAGKTLSNTMAKKLAKVWMENKWGGE
jgi:hypothetical protein